LIWGRRGSIHEVEGTDSMAQRKQKNVLFLCTGNYYRSRIAEMRFNSVAGKVGLPWRASSRGLALERGVNNVGPMADSAVNALETLGHRATDDVTLTPDGSLSRLRSRSLPRKCPGP
jgi:hypothetical protein